MRMDGWDVAKLQRENAQLWPPAPPLTAEQAARQRYWTDRDTVAALDPALRHW